jgi:hypothetical protein
MKFVLTNGIDLSNPLMMPGRYQIEFACLYQLRSWRDRLCEVAVRQTRELEFDNPEGIEDAAEAICRGETWNARNMAEECQRWSDQGRFICAFWWTLGEICKRIKEVERAEVRELTLNAWGVA